MLSQLSSYLRSKYLKPSLSISATEALDIQSLREAAATIKEQIPHIKRALASASNEDRKKEAKAALHDVLDCVSQLEDDTAQVSYE